MRNRAISLAVFLAALGFVAVQAQQPATEPQLGDFRLRSLRYFLTQAPSYGAAGGQGWDRPGTLFRDWLRIEVQFETKLEWADDVKLVYYALLGRANEAKLFKGEVTHMHIAKGAQHHSGMFMHPNAVRRYGGGRVERVAVQLYYRDRLFDQLSDPASNQRWWELLTPQSEALLNPMQTPWAMLAFDHYEAIRQLPRTP